MTERPILFSGPMVCAVLNGSKTVTRRVVTKSTAKATDSMGRTPRVWSTMNIEDARLAGYPPRIIATNHETLARYVITPRHAPGDTLWVRERMRVISVATKLNGAKRPDTIRVRYEADGAESGWIPYPDRLNGDPVIGKCLSYGGFREASRIELLVTNVCIERLHDITESEAQAEGVDWSAPLSDHEPDEDQREVGYPAPGASFALQNFRELWDRINGKRPGCSWADNPWVIATTFQRVTP